MEYAENGSLLELIRQEDHLSEEQSRAIYQQLLDAIDYCHQRGIVHRYTA